MTNAIVKSNLWDLRANKSGLVNSRMNLMEKNIILCMYEIRFRNKISCKIMITILLLKLIQTLSHRFSSSIQVSYHDHGSKK